MLRTRRLAAVAILSLLLLAGVVAAASRNHGQAENKPRARPRRSERLAKRQLNSVSNPFVDQQNRDMDRIGWSRPSTRWPSQIGTCIFRARVRGDIGRSGAALKCQFNDTIYTSDNQTMPASEAKRREIAIECDHSLEVQELLRGLVEPLRASLLLANPDSLRSLCAEWERTPSFNAAIDHLLNGVTNLHFAAKDVNYEKGLMVVGKSSSRNAQDNPGLYAALAKHMEVIRAKRAGTVDEVVKVLDKFWGEHPQAPRPGNYTLTVVEFMKRGRDSFEKWRSSHPAPGGRYGHARRVKV